MAVGPAVYLRLEPRHLHPASGRSCVCLHTRVHNHGLIRPQAGVRALSPTPVENRLPVRPPFRGWHPHSAPIHRLGAQMGSEGKARPPVGGTLLSWPSAPPGRESPPRTRVPVWSGGSCNPEYLVMGPRMMGIAVP